MGRIKNQNLYPIKENIVNNDFFIGSDSENDGTSVSFSVKSVTDFIVDQSTGNIVVNNPDEEDITAVNTELKFKDRVATGNQHGYRIIRADFDWFNIPSNHATSIWEIRYEFDLQGQDVVLPTDVFLYFNGGFISNYNSITGNNTTISTCKPNGFDLSGTLDPTFVFDVCFTQADKDKLDAITGTNTGDQTITLTGDVTGSGTGSFAATIANDAVTFPKIQNAGGNSKLVGSGATGAGNDYEEISLGSGLIMTGTTMSSNAGGTTNLTYLPDSAQGIVESSTGTDATIPAGSTVNASLMLPADKTKLNSLEQSDWDASSGGAEILNKPSVMERIGTAAAFAFTYPSNFTLNSPGNTTAQLFCSVVGICKVANNGYVIGDRVQVTNTTETGNQQGFQFFFESLTATKLFIAQNSLPLIIKNGPTTGGFLSAQWNLEITIWGS